MQELKTTLSKEQSLINAELVRHIGELPPNSRPVAEHVLMAGGKRLRPLLTLLMARALGYDGEDLYTLGAAIEMLHAATLMHDDILDNAPLRRGREAAHVVYGQAPAILAGDAMLAKSLLLVASFGDTRLTACVSEAVMRTAEGEIEEFAHLRDFAMTQADYLSIVTGKTAWMLRASCELGALRAGAQETVLRAAETFGLELGIAFQMVDDALDFSPSSETGKPSGGDVKEGKITPPLLLYLQALPEEERQSVTERFASGSMSEADAERISAAVYTGGYAQQARLLAEEHLAKASNALSIFAKSKERIVLEQMLRYISLRGC